MENNGVIVAALIIVGSVITLAWLYGRRLRLQSYPYTRESQLEVLVENLTKKSEAQDEQIRLLLEDRIRDRARIAELERKLETAERRIRELETVSQSTRSVREFRPRKLNGAQIKQLNAAMLSCYDHDALDRLLKFELNREIEEVSLGGDMVAIMAKVIATANNEGWIGELISKAAAKRERRQDFQNIAAELLSSLRV